eukprot:jgi/Bigna1/67234/fgenesh1_pg.3_\
MWRWGGLSQALRWITLFQIGIASTSHPSTWQPWKWNGWEEKFPSMYFAADPTGLIEDHSRLAKISNFSLAIFEYRMGQFIQDPGWADLKGEVFSEEQCEVLAKLPNAPPCMVYRNGMWAGYFYTGQNQMLNRQELFLKHNADDECNGTLGFSNFAETGRQLCRYNFSNPACSSKFANSVLDEIGNEESVLGSFLDNAESVHCDSEDVQVILTDQERAEIQNATMEAWKIGFAKMVGKGRYPVLSTTNQFKSVDFPVVPFENECPYPEENILESLQGIPFARNYEFFMWQLNQTCSAQIQNMIEESSHGIPVFVHVPWFPNSKGCLGGCRDNKNRIREFSEAEFLEMSIAGFLVGMGKGSYFGFSNMQDKDDPYAMGGWYDSSWKYYSQYDQLRTGKPEGPAEMGADKMFFRRTFKNGNVSLDCRTGAYNLSFPASGLESHLDNPSTKKAMLLPSLRKGTCVMIHGIKRCFTRDFFS